MAFKNTQARHDGPQFLVALQSEVFAPQFSHFAHTATVAGSIEKFGQKERLVGSRDQLAERIVITDTVSCEKREASTLRSLLLRVAKALEQRDGLGADEGGVDEVSITKSTPIFDVPLYLVIFGGDLLGA